jgi:hypothetical protein
MDLFSLQNKLIAAARKDLPAESVPYAFEKRIATRLRSAPRTDHLAEWSGALWRAAVPCAAIMLLFSAWSLFPANGAAGAEEIPGPDLESTVMAAVEADISVESLQ